MGEAEEMENRCQFLEAQLAQRAREVAVVSGGGPMRGSTCCKHGLSWRRWSLHKIFVDPILALGCRRAHLRVGRLRSWSDAHSEVRPLWRAFDSKALIFTLVHAAAANWEGNC